MKKIEKLTKKNLIRRLHLIKEDMQNLELALQLHNVDIYKEDDKGCGKCTYITHPKQILPKNTRQKYR